jgi:type I restriction enzyme, S subunit
MSNYVPLADITQINPQLPKNVNESQDVSFVAMSSVSEDGRILKQETRTLGDTKKGYTYFQRGDVLLAKITPCFENGKAALADNLEHPIGFGSTEFHVLRPIPQQLDAQYLFYMVWSDRFRFLGQKAMKGAAGQKRIPADFLKSFEIPLPPLDDQKRIAYLLGKVEGAIAHRKQHLQQLDDLLKSVFLEMFGDPVRNEKGWETIPFSKIGKFKGGGTPSKSRNDFWSGTFPWVSPKDMKIPRIDDSIDHISEVVFQETLLKRM